MSWTWTSKEASVRKEKSKGRQLDMPLITLGGSILVAVLELVILAVESS